MAAPVIVLMLNMIAVGPIVTLGTVHLAAGVDDQTEQVGTPSGPTSVAVSSERSIFTRSVGAVRYREPSVSKARSPVEVKPVSKTTVAFPDVTLTV